MAQTKDTIQSTLQVDLDLSKVREKVTEANRLEDQAERRAEEIRRKAREVTERLEADERRIESAVHRFEHKVIQHPLKNLGKAAIGMLAADITSGFEAGEGITGFLKKAGTSALFALPAGPEASAIAVLGVAVEQLIESVRDGKREAVEIRKVMLEAEARRRQDQQELEAKIQRLEEAREGDLIRFHEKVRQIAGDLDYDTFILMGQAEG